MPEIPVVEKDVQYRREHALAFAIDYYKGKTCRAGDVIRTAVEFDRYLESGTMPAKAVQSAH